MHSSISSRLECGAQLLPERPVSSFPGPGASQARLPAAPRGHGLRCRHHENLPSFFLELRARGGEQVGAPPAPGAVATPRR